MQAVASLIGGFLWEEIGLVPTFVIFALLHSVGGAVVYLERRS